MSNDDEKKTCCICNLQHQRLFFPHKGVSSSSASQETAESLQEKLSSPSSSSSSLTTPAVVSPAAVTSQPQQQQNAEKEKEDESSSSFTRLVRRVPETVQVDTAAKKAYCEMCYALTFKELPAQVQQVPSKFDKKFWTWKHYRESGFSYPHTATTAASTSSSSSCSSSVEKKMQKAILIVNTGGTFSCLPSKETGLLSPAPLLEHEDNIMKHMQAFSSPNPETNPVLVAEKNHIKFPDAKFVMLESENLMIDSTEASWNEYNLLSMIIAERNTKYSGFVIIHGTDTLAFTAAALSFSLMDLQAPVVVTGSQLPLRGVFGGTALQGNSDASCNLLCALDFVRANPHLRSVFVSFHNKILCGTRAVKIHSQNLDGFHSPNLGVVSYFNGAFVTNSSLLKHIKNSREDEPRVLAAHIAKFYCYYSHFSSAAGDGDAPLSMKVKESGNLSELIKFDQEQRNNNNNNNNEQSPASSSLLTMTPSPSSSASPVVSCSGLSASSFPSALQMSDCSVFYDFRHKSGVQRFHKDAKILVFQTRPTAMSGASALKEQLLEHASFDTPAALILLAYGSGNAQQAIKELLTWAREFLFIPVVFTSQCFAGASMSHYAVGLNSKQHGINVFDQEFSSIYTRLALTVSTHIFIQTGEGYAKQQGSPSTTTSFSSPPTHNNSKNNFKRCREYRDAVEDLMQLPHRLAFTVPEGAASLTPQLAEEEEKFKIVRDCQVSSYLS